MADKPKDQYSNLCTPFSFISFEMSFDNLYKHYFDQLTYIAMRLIVFRGLPDTISETFLKYCLLINGKAVFFKLDKAILDNRQSAVTPLKVGDLVALNGKESDMQTLYYMHRNVLVTNPVLTKTYNLTPGEDCEIVYCTEPDKYKEFGYGGLFVLLARTATILADNDISINCAQKNTRLVNIMAADDSVTAASAEIAVKSMYAGDPYKIVTSNLIGNLQGIPMTQRTATNDIVQLIEMRQYIYSHFYESLGLQTHDNMKKERLITEEINDNEEISALNIDDILTSIQEGLTRVNALFGTEISAELNPIVQRAHENDDKLLDAAEDDPAPEDPEDQDIFASYDSAALREIIRGLKKDIDPEDDPPEQDELEDQTEDEPDDQSEDQPEPEQDEPEPEDQSDDQSEDKPDDQTEDQPEPEQDEPEPAAPEQQIEIEINAEDEADVEIEIQSGEEADGEDV